MNVIYTTNNQYFQDVTSNKSGQDGSTTTLQDVLDQYVIASFGSSKDDIDGNELFTGDLVRFNSDQVGRVLVNSEMFYIHFLDNTDSGDLSSIPAIQLSFSPSRSPSTISSLSIRDAS